MANGYVVWGDGTSTATVTSVSYGFTPPSTPITYNGNTYLFANRETLGTLGAYLSAFKRIIPVPGATPYFTPLNTANDPFLDNGNAQVYYPRSGGSLAYIGYLSPSSSSLRLITFDLASETWGTVITTAGPTVANNNFKLIKRTTADWVVIYSSLTGPEVLDNYFQVFNGTSWGTATIITNVSTASNDSTGLYFVAHKPANDSIAIWWDQTYSSEAHGTHHHYLTILDSSNAVGTHYNWDNRTNAGVAWEQSGMPVYNPGEDAWDSPILQGSNTTFVPLCVAHHTPANSPNATTTSMIIGGPNISNVAFPRLAVDASNNKLYFSWPNNYDGLLGNNQLLFITRQADGTSTWAVTTTTDQWGDPLYIPAGMVYTSNTADDWIEKGTLTNVIFDAGTDTLYPTPVKFGNIWLDLMHFSVNTGVIKSVTNPNCDYQYFFQYGGVTPPTLSCPVSSVIGLGTVYIGTMVVTNGTGPFTFTVLG